MFRSGILFASISVLAGAGIVCAQSSTAIQTIIEYAIPTANSQPNAIVTGPDGNLWFTESYSSKIGRITPAGAITEYPTPTAASGPAGIAKGPDGNLWFTEQWGNKIGKISTSGSIAEYPVPTAGSGPSGITAGPDGNMWFTEYYPGNIGKITPNGVISEYPCVFSDQDGNLCSLAHSIAAGPDGKLWYAPTTADQIGLMSTSGAGSSVGGFFGGVTRIRSPQAITSGPDGNMWFTESTGVIEAITTGGQFVGFYSAGGGSPGAIITGPDGHIWFVGTLAGLGSLSGADLTEFPIPSAAAGIAGGPDGNIWFTEQATSTIGTLLLSGGPPSSAPAISPSSLTFSTIGSAPPSQTLSVSPAGSTAFTASAAIAPAEASWLKISPSGNLTGSQTITVSADPSGLPGGTYVGWVNIKSGVVTETLTVTFNVDLDNVTVYPSPLSFVYTTGGTTPSPVSVTITSAQGALYATPYTVSALITTPTGGNWLTIGAGQTSGTTPGYANVSVNPAGLAAGTYTGSIVITPTGGAAVTVPVTLTVTTAVVLTASPTTLSFLYQPGGGYNTTRQQLQVGEPSVVASTNFTATATSTPAGWLSVSPASGTINSPSGSAMLDVTVAPAGLTRGAYTGSITITPSGGQPVTVPVSLTVSNPVLLVNPSSLMFSYPYMVAPAPQSIQVSAPGNAALPFLAVGDLNGFVTVSPTSGTTPATVTVTPTSAALSWLPGDAATNISVSGAATDDPQTGVLVDLHITAAAITASPASLSFSYRTGGSLPPPQSLLVTGAGNAIVPISTVSSVNWLSVVSGFGNTPMTPSVSVNPAGLAPGSYTGNVLVSVRYNGDQPPAQQTVPVTLTITSGTAISAAPTSLSFSYQTGGTLPASQSIQLTASGGAAVAFTVESTSSGNWLSVTPTSGTTPATLVVSVNPSSLTTGTYNSTFTVSGTVIQVSLTVSASPPVTASPISLSFSYAAGGTVPPAQSIQLSAAGNAAVPFAVQWGSAAWLSVTPTSGTTPASLAVSVSALGFAAGSYSANIVINNTLTIPVSLTVTYPSVLPVINSVLNAASYASGAVSPGEIVSIFGTSIGPVTPALLTLDATGKVSTNLAGVQVSFNGYAAPLTYVSSTQINTIVPYEVAGNPSPPFVEVSYGGETSNAVGVHVTDTAPALFTQNSSGTGPGDILNADSTLNTEQNPAATGTTIQIFMTGEGLTTPAQATGAVTPVNTSGNGPLTPAPQSQVSVTIGGQPATLDFAGEAPYFVAGVLQVNARVPATAAPGANSIVVKVGDNSSQTGVTVWVQ